MIKLALKLIGESLYVFSLLFLVPAAYSLIYSEFYYSLTFSLISIFLVVIGYYFRKENVDLNELKIKPFISIFSLVLSWLILPTVGAIPFFVYLHFQNSLNFENIFNSIFQSFSSWTTTGFLIFDFQKLSETLKFWLAFEQWMGGLGIITLIVFVLKSNDIAYQVIKFEGKEDFIESTIRHSIIELTKFYIIMTFIFISFLSFSGLNVKDSLLISLAVLPTGGITDISNLNFAQKIMVEIFMIASSITFSLYIFVFRGNFKTLKKYESIYWFIFVLILLLFISMFFKSNTFDSYFHIISAITTTGFSYLNLTNYSESYLVLIIVLMSIGGMMGSTAGGIRIDRIAILIKGTSLKIKKFINPKNAEIYERFSNTLIDEKTLSYVGIFLFAYISISLLSTLVLYFINGNLINSAFVTISSLSNVGLTTMEISKLDIISKVIILIIMVVGRLEIFVAIAFIPAIYKIIKKE